jgi:hypothetical protein
MTFLLPHHFLSLILSKFWGDEIEEVEEVMEDTLNHDKRLELEDYPSLSESTKTERKKKKQGYKVSPSNEDPCPKGYLQSRLGRYRIVGAIEYLRMSLLLFKFS